MQRLEHQEFGDMDGVNWFSFAGLCMDLAGDGTVCFDSLRWMGRGDYSVAFDYLPESGRYRLIEAILK